MRPVVGKGRAYADGRFDRERVGGAAAGGGGDRERISLTCVGCVSKTEGDRAANPIKIVGNNRSSKRSEVTASSYRVRARQRIDRNDFPR